MTKIEAKLILIRGIIRNLEDEPDANRLYIVLTTMESALVRDKDCLETNYEDIVAMKTAIRDAGDLLQELLEGEADLMQNWFHGAPPKNQAFALANLLSRIILELSLKTLLFQNKYPQLATMFA
jgi:hypothetical protein